MSDNKIEIIKKKLRAILAHVQNNSNEHERNNAMARLQELLVKHRLDMADIEDKAKEDIVRIEVVGRNGPWARSVAQSISKLNFCNYYFHRQGSSNDQRFVRHVFVGRAHEAEVAKELSMLIIDQLASEAAKQARQRSNPSFERSFLNGASHAIYSRVQELIRSASAPSETQSAGTALMIVNAYEQAEDENRQFIVASVGPLKTTASRMKTKSYEGVIEGKAFGNKIPLNITKKLG